MEQQYRGGLDINSSIKYISDLAGNKWLKVIGWILLVMSVMSFIFIIIDVFRKQRSLKGFNTWIDIGLALVSFFGGAGLIVKTKDNM